MPRPGPQPEAYTAEYDPSVADDIPHQDAAPLRPGVRHTRESESVGFRARAAGRIGVSSAAQPVVRPAGAVAPSESYTAMEPAADVPEVVAETEIEPAIDEVLAREERSTPMGNPRITRFLARQVLRESANVAVDAAAKDDQVARDAGQPLPAPKVVMNINFWSRPAEPEGDNLELKPNEVHVTDAGAFEPGGAVDQMDSPTRLNVLTAITAGDDIGMRREHRSLLRTAEKALTQTQELPDGREVVTYRPFLGEIIDAIGIMDNSRLGEDEDYADSPVYLDADQIIQVQNTLNGKRLEGTADAAALHRLRATLDDIGVNIAQPLPGDDEPPLTSTQLLPRARRGELPPVMASRLSVRPDSKGDFYTDEVMGLGQVALAIAKTGNGNTVPRMVIEGAEKLARMASQVLEEIIDSCANAIPPIPLTTFYGPNVDDKMRPYMGGSKTAVTPKDPAEAQQVAPFLPPRLMVDLQSTSESVSGTDGVSTGQAATIGYDMERANPNGGTSANSGGTIGTNGTYSETNARSVRPPHPHELQDNLDTWQAVHYPADGSKETVYDLRARGVPIRRSLQPERRDDNLGTQREYNRIRNQQQSMRDANRRGDGITAAPPLHPTPPIKNKQRENIDKIPKPMRMMELSKQLGEHGTVTRTVVTEAMNDWRRQTRGTESLPPLLQQQSWVQWCREHNIRSSQARQVWRRQHGR